MSISVAPPPLVRRVPGETGIWILLLGDMTVFAAFFATFMVERGKAPEVFDAARKTLHTNVGMLNTLVLLASSLCVVAAVGAVRARATIVARRMFSIAAVCGVVFIGLKGYEYASLVLAGHGVGANHFYLYYFVLTGIHLFHVCIGVVVLIVLRSLGRASEPSATRVAVIESGGCFWHLVDLLWIVLFPLLYLVS